MWRQSTQSSEHIDANFRNEGEVFGLRFGIPQKNTSFRPGVCRVGTSVEVAQHSRVFVREEFS